MCRRPNAGAVALRWFVLAMMLIGSPLVGIILAGGDPATFLQIPPVTRYVRHAGFSWTWFVLFGIIDVLLVLGLAGALACGWRNRRRADFRPVSRRHRFAWWGWGGLTLCLGSWVLAWQRFDWFHLFQQHTFLPIWTGFIFAVNALSAKRSGRCLMFHRPVRFLLLFPASAVFWWLFEYLNRFVQNWYYTGIEDMTPTAYGAFASLAFATVLPGVMSMIDLLATVPALGHGLARCRSIRLPATRSIPVVTLAVAAVGLALVGTFPDALFALLWVSPLLIMISLEALTGGCPLIRPLETGDWRRIAVPVLAALICGFFWEMWNYFSLARWSYTIPHVQRFPLFEMPVLGYGGYAPFGLICLLAALPVVGDPFTPVDST